MAKGRLVVRRYKNTFQLERAIERKDNAILDEFNRLKNKGLPIKSKRLTELKDGLKDLKLQLKELEKGLK